MTCTYEKTLTCPNGYDYGYAYQMPGCCNAGMTTFWSIFLWISLGLCICLCCSMMIAMMRRRRMQQMQMMAQQRNQGAPRARRGSDSSSEDSLVVGRPVVVSSRPVYNAPIGGSAPPPQSYAPPAMPVAPLSVGVRPAVDTSKGTT